MGLATWLYMGGRNRQFVTKKLQLPVNWDKLVERYKDLVPTYIRYWDRAQVSGIEELPHHF